MRELYTEIDINAPSRKELLTNFERYPEWNPFIKRVKGQPRVGEKLEVLIQPPGARVRMFKPTLVRVEPERELSWFGRLFLAGLFDGQHSFIIEKGEDQQIRFVHTELFSGMFVPFVWSRLKEATLSGFTKMNEALKEMAEKSDRHPR